MNWIYKLYFGKNNMYNYLQMYKLCFNSFSLKIYKMFKIKNYPINIENKYKVQDKMYVINLILEVKP